jgi:hypothetical protein
MNHQKVTFSEFGRRRWQCVILHSNEGDAVVRYGHGDGSQTETGTERMLFTRVYVNGSPGSAISGD